MPLGTKVGLSPGDSVLDGDPALLPQKGEPPPQFLAYFYCGQTAVCIKMSLGMEIGLSPGGFVLHGDPAPSPSQKGGGAAQFSAHVYCGQSAGWIKMALGMEVGLGPVHIAHPLHPIFGPCLLWPNGWMDEDAA